MKLNSLNALKFNPARVFQGLSLPSRVNRTSKRWRPVHGIMYDWKYFSHLRFFPKRNYRGSLFADTNSSYFICRDIFYKMSCDRYDHDSALNDVVFQFQ